MAFDSHPLRCPVAMIGLLAIPPFLGGCDRSSAMTATSAEPAASPSAAAAEAPARVRLADWPFSVSGQRGAAVYARYCIGCHGPEGLGDGTVSSFLEPLPRNFQKGNFKFRSTPYGTLPAVADILQVITCGLPGSAMPGFPLVPEQQRRDVATYVRELAMFGKGRTFLEDELEERGKATTADLGAKVLAEVRTMVEADYAGKAVTVPASPNVTEELIAAGKEAYANQCVACHGATGRGDGTSSFHLRDWKDSAIPARDFTSGVFRAGSTPEDLFRRMRTGLSGTPMPQIYGSDEDLWALAHYIISLKDPNAPATGKPFCRHEGGESR